MEAQSFLSNKEIIQELQDTYSQATRISICICNREGKLMTEMSGSYKPTESFSEVRTEMEVVLQGQVPNLQGLRNPTLYDNWIPGLKFISVPIVVGGKPLYFLFAGFLIVEGTKDRINLDNAGLTPRFHRFMQEALIHTPEMNSERAEAKRVKIGKLAEAISVIVEQGSTGFAVNDRVRQFHNELFVAGHSRLFPVRKLRELFHKSPLGEIVGIALEKTPGELQIVDCIGTDGDKIIGARFRTGEGFLGQAMLNVRDSEWTDILRDPRSEFFHKAGIRDLETIYCFPIQSGSRIIGVIFCISMHPQEISSHIVDLEKMFFSFIASYSGNELAYRQVELQLGRVKPLMDAAQFINTIPDMKRMSFTLAEISLNLAIKPLGALVVQQEDSSNQLHVVARGIDNERVDVFVNEMMQLYFTAEPGSLQVSNIRRTDNGTSVLELPVSYDNRIRAVLLVELGNDKHAEESREILQPLATVYGLSLKSFYERHQALEMTDYTARFLGEVMAAFRPDEQQTAWKMERLAAGYADWSGMPESDGKQLARAALLSAWDPALLEKANLFGEEAAMIRGHEQVLSDGANRRSQEIQILAILSAYFANDESLGSLEKVPGVEEVISHSFRSFIMSRQTLESRFTIPPLSGDKLSVPSAYFGAEPLEEIASRTGLSTREKEVLRLVIKASSNKEIAAALFISEHTVKNHLSNIFQKMGVSDRTQAIAAVFNLR